MQKILKEKKGNWYFVQYRTNGVTNGVIVRGKDPEEAIQELFPIDQLLNVTTL